jgi:Eukaryotic aspartyl protease
LKVVPIQTVEDIYAEFLVTVTNISFTDGSGTSSSLTSTPDFSEQFLLDSGTTFLYLPSDIVNSLATKLSAVTTDQGYFVDCNFRFSQSSAFLTFTFGGASAPTINVPLSELLYDTEAAYGFPFSSVCELGIMPLGPSLILGESNPYVLGDTFLRSAYVVYDLTHNEIGLAQANFGSTTSNIVELKAADSGIPALTGVASGVTQISTDLFLSAASTAAATSTSGAFTTSDFTASDFTTSGFTTTGFTTTGFATFTNTASTGPTTTPTLGAKSDAVGPVPAFGTAAVAVLAVSGLFATLGSLVIIL